MKESIGYSVTINIIVTFLIIIFAFLAAAVVYFKANKASNIIVDTIQKYEGYNATAKKEITGRLKTLGYGSRSINCKNEFETDSAHYAHARSICEYKDPTNPNPSRNNGYCVYLCRDIGKEDYYYYKVRINMMISIPVIEQLVDIPIYANTDRMFDFEKAFK